MSPRKLPPDASSEFFRMTDTAVDSIVTASERERPPVVLSPEELRSVAAVLRRTAERLEMLALRRDRLKPS